MTAAERTKALGSLLAKLRAAYPDVIGATDAESASPALTTTPGATVNGAGAGHEGAGARAGAGDGAVGGVDGSADAAGGRESGVLADDEPALRELLRSMLVWEATEAKAEAALRKLDAACVDLNELRVSLTEELVAVIGPGYPRAGDRCARLKLALNELYRREHRVTLAGVTSGKVKRDVRGLLEGLAGVPPFAAARVCLRALGVHAMPVDEHLLTRLVSAGVIEPETDAAGAAAALERMVRAGAALEAYTLLQRWADDGSTVVVKHGKPGTGRAGGKPGLNKAGPGKATPAKAPGAKPAGEPKPGGKAGARVNGAARGGTERPARRGRRGGER